MCHVTRHCNVIGPHRTVQWDMASIHRYTVQHTLLFLAEVALACETKLR